ncbi:MAG: HD domain-containing phosphohydrolase [Oleiphilaceae bacterium]|nr:HD domain-containing phosphohydrolase [Oleiphilaceae bacterium]
MPLISCPQFTDLDREIIDDFLECLQENVEAIEQCIEDLDQEVSPELINHLFRDVHSLKGNCRMVFLEPMVDAVHALEEVVSDMRQEQRAYTPAYGEFFMAIVLRQRAAILELMQHGEVDDANLTLMRELIERVAASSDSNARDVIDQAMDELVGVRENDDGSSKPMVAQVDLATETKTGGGFNEDLDFFQSLAVQMDMVNPYHHGRSAALVDLCVATNADLGYPVDEQQLKAAVYLHDIGMALVPAQIMEKPGRLNPAETKVIQGHVEIGTQLLHRMPGWDGATEIVLQHHERFDGKGYPYGLSGEAINPGAQILALADTFYAITHVRADRSTKKSLFGAMSLINGESGAQFDPKFVEAFNETIRHLYVSNKQAV